ncbi:MAG: ATP-binding protein [Lentisphaeria bacterium]|nr:ATP-binding protein [Lentisphaeria bacterium]
MAKYVRRQFSEIVGGSYFLFGPRGTGKTLWLRHTHPEAHCIDLLESDTHRSYAARPERLREFLAGLSTGPKTVVVDEIQKVPQLLDEVHQWMSQDPSTRFILTGSSARKLKQQGVDLLAGRAAVLTMHPFMGFELQEEFSLTAALQWGMLPVVWRAEDREAALGAYLGVYLREEVQQEGLVRSVGSFSRFLEAISFSHGGVLNASAVARECQVSRSTVEGYLSILEDLLLGFRIPVFNRRAARKLVVHPKFYLLDCGVYRKLRPRGPLDRSDEIGGAALEGLVAQHLRAWIAYSRKDHKLHYWRTKAGNEVDFVIYGSDCFAAVEVKAARRVERRDLRGLRAFLDDYPESDAILLYGGKERLRINGILCLPCEQFLRDLAPASELPH